MPLVANYTPTDWVNNVTPVDEAHMDKMETAIDQHADAINTLDTRLAAEEAQPDIPAVVTGKWIKGVAGAAVWSDVTIADIATLQTTLNAKQDSSAKGVVNGYAGLDSTGKVPTAQLPVPLDLRWAGAWIGASAYKEGDVVIYNGVSYMALRATTGEAPVPWSTATGGGGTLVSASNALASDANLTPTGTYVDGPVVSVAAGTWLVSGQILVTRGSNTGFVTAKLWDGSASPVASGEFHSSGFASGQGMSIPLSGIVVLAAAGSLKISAAANAGGHVMRTATQANGNLLQASALVAVKIA